MKRFFFLLACLLFGCSRDCADVGCTTFAEFMLRKALSDEGSYLIEIVADGEQMSCEVQIPSSSEGECDDSVGITRTEGGSNIGGSGGDSSGEEIASVGVLGTYQKIRISITHGERLIADDQVEPDYQGADTQDLNCGSCLSSEHELEVQL